MSSFRSHLTAIGLACLAGGLVALSAVAQVRDDRVEIIMGHLPPAGSAQYRKLIRLAGDAKGQVLPLTKCELWSVPRSRLAALTAAAASRNISVKVLDGSWNEIMAPMSTPPASMAEGGKALVDMAMKSKATAGVGMMSTRTASMVEYALTKGVTDGDSAGRPMSIKIALRAGDLDPDKVNPEDIKPYITHMVHVDLPMFLKMLRAAGDHTAESYLADVKVPTLIVAGEKDSFTPASLSEAMAERIPGAELLMVKRGTHVAPLEQHEVVRSRISKFIRERVLEHGAK